MFYNNKMHSKPGFIREIFKLFKTLKKSFALEPGHQRSNHFDVILKHSSLGVIYFAKRYRSVRACNTAFGQLLKL